MYGCQRVCLSVRLICIDCLLTDMGCCVNKTSKLKLFSYLEDSVDVVLTNKNEPWGDMNVLLRSSTQKLKSRENEWRILLKVLLL